MASALRPARCIASARRTCASRASVESGPHPPRVCSACAKSFSACTKFDSDNCTSPSVLTSSACVAASRFCDCAICSSACSTSASGVGRWSRGRCARAASNKPTTKSRTVFARAASRRATFACHSVAPNAASSPSTKDHRQRHAAAMTLREFPRAIPARRRMRAHRASVEIALDVVGQRAGRRIAPLRFLGQRFQQDVVEIAAQRRTQLQIGHARGRVAADRAHRLGDARRRPPRRAFRADAEQQFVQQHAETVDIGRRGDRRRRGSAPAPRSSA